jgi:ferredoxin
MSTHAAMSLSESARQQRAVQQRQVRLLAGGIILAALLAIIALALMWSLNLVSVLGALGGGGVSWGLLSMAVRAIRERLRFADVPQLLQARGGLGITLIALALLTLTLWGLAKIPGIAIPALLGAIAAVAVGTLRWAQDALRPRFHIRMANDGRTLILNAGTSLIDNLRARGYDLFAQCGGKGQCATCRVRVLEGPSKWGPAQQGILTPALLQEDWVLACQVRVQADMVIELFKPLVLGWPTLDGRPAPSERRLVAAGLPQLSPRAQRLRCQLPGFNCAACGYETCDAYAQAIIENRSSLDRCLPGGKPVRAGLEAEAQALELAQVMNPHA